MLVTQQKLITVLSDQIDQIDEDTRVEGYRHDLFDILGQIVMLEKEHLESRTQIQKKVSDKAQALATTLLREGWDPT